MASWIDEIDYSRIEARAMAHMTSREDYEKWINDPSITQEQRNARKALAFGFMYGQKFTKR